MWVRVVCRQRLAWLRALREGSGKVMTPAGSAGQVDRVGQAER